jgi:hypothetical protein
MSAYKARVLTLNYLCNAGQAGACCGWVRSKAATKTEVSKKELNSLLSADRRFVPRGRHLQLDPNPLQVVGGGGRWGHFGGTKWGHPANAEWRRVATSGCNRVNERSALRAGIFKA